MDIHAVWTVFLGIAPVIFISVGTIMIMLQVIFLHLENPKSKHLIEIQLILAAILCAISFTMLHVQWKNDSESFSKLLDAERAQTQQCQEAHARREHVPRAF